MPSTAAATASSRQRRRKAKDTSSSIDDALEQKLRKKKQQEKVYQDKLEAKIRQKQKAAYSSNNNDGDDDDDDYEEEKLEEGMISSRHSSGGGDNTSLTSSKKKRKKKKQRPSSSPTNSYKSLDNNANTQTDENGQPLFTKGGGDVRNKPPPSLADIEAARKAAIDPLRAAEAEREKDKQKVNPKFADLHETGQWGKLSEWEKRGIAVVTLGVIGVAIWLGIQFGGGGGGGEETVDNLNNVPRTRQPTLSPSMTPTLAPTVTGYRLTTGLSMMKLLSPSIALPNNPEALKGAKTRSGSTPQMLAAEFILYDDAQNVSVRDPTFLERYALAVFYYANGGCSGDWITGTNWMDPVNATNHCGVTGGDGRWHGVFCNLQGRVTEVKMNGNYVTWKLPREFAAFTELSTLEVSDNRMVGELPSEAISMPKLFTLLLNNNDFEGDFPFDVVKQGAASLDTLWIQENSKLSGRVPTSFCSLGSITLDCANFEPQPVYVSPDSTETTFVADCKAEPEGISPREYTCNTELGVPVEKPVDAPLPAPRVCGTPAVGT
eukprot:CAMPEP_0201695498 /NCGR_PEP_ID=MMETSP0578-20130828/7415_1 /ASSEMBLY_ACC=CAM_ASM_000663 /TAXON_ID=267565 /ORGANISM="Skeletonema grethea, Strain CCMP 1804" /LENGTH=547 /DNA_ID=CAMNT_0048181343 /DNA_START=82 /DNA_END=1725 /DNA_ORIENTATION=+